MKLECGVSAEWPIWSKTLLAKVGWSALDPPRFGGFRVARTRVEGPACAGPSGARPLTRVRVPSLGCASPQLTLTSIWRGCAFSSFGRTTLSTPSLVSARMAELSTLSGRSKERWNLPAIRSRRSQAAASVRVTGLGTGLADVLPLALEDQSAVVIADRDVLAGDAGKLCLDHDLRIGFADVHRRAPERRSVRSSAGRLAKLGLV